MFHANCRPLMRICVAFLIAVLFSSVMHGADTVVGKVWEITINDNKDKLVEIKEFRATPRGKLFAKDGAEVGTFTEKGNDVRLNIKVGRYQGAHGLAKLEKSPPTWQGVWTLKSGERRKVSLKLLKD